MLFQCFLIFLISADGVATCCDDQTCWWTPRAAQVVAPTLGRLAGPATKACWPHSRASPGPTRCPAAPSHRLSPGPHSQKAHQPVGQQPAPEKQPGLEQAGVLETTSSLLGQEVVCQNAGRLVGGGQEEGAASRLFARRSDKKCNFFGRSSAHQRPPQKPVGPAEGGYRGSKGQLLFLKKNSDIFF